MTQDYDSRQDGVSLKILLWSARIIGTFFVIFCIYMFVESLLEGKVRHSSFSFDEDWNGLLIATGMCFLIGIAGLIVALRYEGEGGLVALIGMVAFIIMTKYNPEAHFRYRYFLLLIPSLLYLLYWWFEKKE